MATIHFWQWLMDFLGINNSYNDFSTHMYNFWSGIGGNISVLALAGVLVGIYRHYHQYLSAHNPVKIVQKPLQMVHHNTENGETGPTDDKNPKA